MATTGRMNDMPNIEVDSMTRNPPMPRSNPAIMDDDKDVGAAIEPDGGPIADDEAKQEPSSPTLTRPKKAMDKTNDALRLLGAGSPYKGVVQ